MDRAHIQLVRQLANHLEALWFSVPDTEPGPTLAAVLELKAHVLRSAVVQVGFPGLYHEADSLDNEREHMVRPGFRAACRSIPRQGRLLLDVWAEARGVPLRQRRAIADYVNSGSVLAFPVFLAHMQGAGLGGHIELNHSIAWRHAWSDVFSRPLPHPISLRPSGYEHDVVADPPRGIQLAWQSYGNRFVPSDRDGDEPSSDEADP